MLSSQNLQVWPMVSQYDKALQNAKTTVYDNDIRGGTLDMDATGIKYLNDAKVGNRYVCVYRVSEWVVKCLTGTPPQDIHERYRAINDYVLQYSTRLSFLVPTRWIDKGIRIDGR